MALNINYAKNKGFNCPLPAPAFAPIGSVGTAGQMAAGHVLTAASFPSAAVGANLSWYSLAADGTDASGNSRPLTPAGSPVYTGTDIFGATGTLVLNGSSQYLKSTDPFFNPGDNDFTTGIWANSSNWQGADQGVISQYNTSSARSFYLRAQGVGICILYSTNGSDEPYTDAQIYPCALTGWNHLVLRYTAAINTFHLYVNGKRVWQVVATGNINTASTPKFNIGCYNDGTNFFNGKMDEFFFTRYAMSDNDIAKICARKYSHNQNILPVSQTWIFKGQNGGQTRDLLDNIIDMQANDLYYDLSDEMSTTQVSLRLANIY